MPKGNRVVPEYFLAAIGDGPLDEQAKVFLDMATGFSVETFFAWDTDADERDEGNTTTEVVGTCLGYRIEFGASEARGTIKMVLDTEDDKVSPNSPRRHRNIKEDAKAAPGGSVRISPSVQLDNRDEAMGWSFSLSWTIDP